MNNNTVWYSPHRSAAGCWEVATAVLTNVKYPPVVISPIRVSRPIHMKIAEEYEPKLKKKSRNCSLFYFFFQFWLIFFRKHWKFSYVHVSDSLMTAEWWLCQMSDDNGWKNGILPAQKTKKSWKHNGQSPSDSAGYFNFNNLGQRFITGKIMG